MTQKVFVLPYKMASKSAKRIAQELGCPLLDPRSPMSFSAEIGEGSTQAGDTPLVLNWGCGWISETELGYRGLRPTTNILSDRSINDRVVGRIIVNYPRHVAEAVSKIAFFSNISSTLDDWSSDEDFDPNELEIVSNAGLDDVAIAGRDWLDSTSFIPVTSMIREGGRTSYSRRVMLDEIVRRSRSGESPIVMIRGNESRDGRDTDHITLPASPSYTVEQAAEQLNASITEAKRNQTEPQKLFLSLYEPVEFEFRVHINQFGARISERRPASRDTSTEHPVIRTGESWYMAAIGRNERQTDAARKALVAANLAYSASALDFAAIDVGVREDGRPIVFEANTAPSDLGPKTRAFYKWYVETLREAMADCDTANSFCTNLGQARSSNAIWNDPSYIWVESAIRRST